MRVFVAGATGVLGRRVVPLLVASGCRVVGGCRSERNRRQLEAQGAEPRPVDLFDRAAVIARTADCDAILHLATAIPSAAPPFRADWRLNDRIRLEGTANLLGAAVHNRCAFYLQQSVTLVYGDRGGAWTDEGTPPARALSAMLESAVEMERQVFEASRRHGLPAAILRFGMFYAPDSQQTRGMIEAARRRMLPLIGAGDAWWNLCHADDAARAVAAALARRAAAAGGCYNICESEPLLARDVIGGLARLTGAPPPRRIPASLARLVLGSAATRVLLSSARCRNDLARTTLGWRPEHAALADGLKTLVIPAEDTFTRV